MGLIGLVLPAPSHNTYIHCMYTWVGPLEFWGPVRPLRLPALRTGPDHSGRVSHPCPSCARGRVLASRARPSSRVWGPGQPCG